MTERKDLFSAWLKTNSSVIAHCGAEALGDARELARYAATSGAKAIAAMPPTFFKPANAKALALTIASICEAAPGGSCFVNPRPHPLHTGAR
jgi:N-acetylneuraminate lyase